MLRRLTLGLVVLGLAAAIAACSSNSTSINGGTGIGPNFATNSVYAAIASTNAISIYPAPLSTLTPSYQIGGSTTTLDGPQYVAFDASGNLWTTNYDTGTGIANVVVFKVLATGAVYPLQSLSYADMGQPRGIAIDKNGNVAIASVYPAAVSPALPSQIQFFTISDGSGSTPYQIISGPTTGLNVPSGIAYDTNGTLYVANRQGASVEAFAFPTPSPTPSTTATPSPTPSPTPTPGAGPTPTASPTPSPVPLATDQPPTLDIAGASTGLSNPSGVAIDATGIIYVSDAGNASVRIFAAGSTGNVAPTRVISGALTGLQIPTDIKVDSTGKIYVADGGAGKIFVFAAGATGNVAPTTTLTSSTGLVGIGLSP